MSAYRLLATVWGLLLFACGALVLRRARGSEQVAVLYGLVALVPYSISTAGTCSNYAPAIGLGQLLAAAACAAILPSEPRVRRLAAAVFLAGAWAGVFLWADFIFAALFGTVVAATWAGAERLARAGLSRRARLQAAAAGLVLAAAAAAVLLATVRRILAARTPGDLDTVGPKTMVFMALLALSPLAVVAAAQAWVPRLVRRPEAEGRRTLASVSAALAALAVGGFLLTSWTKVESSTFPRLVGAYARTFLSNAFAWDQDPIAWKFWLGVFGWHDAFYPDPVYALARWGFVVLLAAFPLLAAPFLRKRPAATRALLLVSGAAVSCGVVSLTLRYLAPMVPYGRFVLPVLPLAALPLVTLLEGPGRERVLRGALLAAAALQVWTAVAVLGSRWAFAT